MSYRRTEVEGRIPGPQPIEYYPDEQSLIEASLTSLDPGGDVRELLHLPRQVNGLKILDIGGGGSTLTQGFLWRGRMHTQLTLGTMIYPGS